MSLGALFKRTIAVLIGLVLIGTFALTAVYQYIDNSPDAQERMKLSVERAEISIDEDDGLLTRLGALIAAWWDSDKLVAEARDEEREEAKAKARRERDRFMDETQNYNDDYYGAAG